MFTYPINRKKLLAAKLLIAGGLTFVTILISNACVAVGFSAELNLWDHPRRINSFYRVSAGSENDRFAFGAAGTSLVPIFLE